MTNQMARPESETPSIPIQAPQPDPTIPAGLMVEAALFSAGKPLSIDEIHQITGIEAREIRNALNALHADYAARATSLDIVKSGEKWALALRPRFADRARHIVPPEIPIHVLRTLALIAYHQPVLQSDILHMVGAKVYEHVQVLSEAGLVSKREHGVSFTLRTTESFPEYFGIPANDADAIRRVLAERVGLIARPPGTIEEGRGKEATAAAAGSEAPPAGPAAQIGP